VAAVYISARAPLKEEERGREQGSEKKERTERGERGDEG